jgi:signal transduction histidine kinase
MKIEFLASMSHELRTPLNGILGFAELLEGELEDASQRDYAQTIRVSGEHLLRLVNDVLDLAKIEAGRMDFDLELVDLPELLQEIVAVQRGHAQKKNLTLEVSDEHLPPVVFADGARLRQILLNLTSNALKFTTQGGVMLRAMSAGEGAGRVRIEVQDSGDGIRAEDLEVIFEKFHQNDRFATRSREGTGLGLTLAKQLVEHMGGEIGVTSTPGAGSIFYVVLPATNERALQK